MAKYRKEIEAWAVEHYNDSFGVSAIVECWGDDEYATYDHHKSAKAALKAVQEDYVGALDEQYLAANDW